MQRLLLSVVALGALLLGIGLVVRHFTPAETKIRRLVAEMEAAYDRGDPRGCVAPIAREWRHDGYEIDRQLLFGALLETAQERDRATHELPTRVTIDEDAATVTVEGARAKLELEARFERRRGGEWRETWRIRVEAELEERDGAWQIVHSRHEDLAGTELGR